MRDNVVTSPHAADAGSAPRLNRRQAAKVRTRQKVLDAARNLFGERGYDAATIRDIAKGAGMSTGAVFANFQDKTELFDAVLTEDMTRMGETVKAAAAAETSLKAKLNAALAAAYHVALEQLPLVQAVIARSWFQPVDAEMRARETVRPTFSVIGDTLRAGVAEGELRQDTDVRLLSELIYDAYVANYRRAAYDNWSIQDLTAHVAKQVDVILAGSISRQ